MSLGSWVSSPRETWWDETKQVVHTPFVQNAYLAGHSQNDSEGELVGVNRLEDVYFHVLLSTFIQERSNHSIVNIKKSFLTISQQFLFLGMNLDSGTAHASLPIQKTLIRSVLTMPHARLYMGSVQIYLKIQWNRQIHDISHKVMTPLRLKAWEAQGNAEEVQSPWTSQQARVHINVLELWAVYSTF